MKGLVTKRYLNGQFLRLDGIVQCHELMMDGKKKKRFGRKERIRAARSTYQ